ncbi:4-hydroxyproline epimerase [Roseateles sp. YR242]|uniref:proline racemase family protein n=1 Tax=Roseateles sp. YR242 TaxID=1855305 RepID=UPI0008C72AB6|nr:proline racemase family protein [Roseateles sp. YR242]SEL50532.1 4-hydroxyproline epimerase [Roseateles sp. YR242]
MTLSALPLGLPAGALPGGLDTTTRVVDSHTGGQPTRLVVGGGPALYGATMAQRLEEMQHHHDAWRLALVSEPRGHHAMVGALLTEPERPGSQAGVIFFDQQGFLGMCGHGAIGVVASLAHLGKLRPGPLWLDTPVGTVHAEFMLDGSVSLQNVPSYRHLAQVAVTMDGQTFHGDVAWGGNWFFICADHGQALRLEDAGRLASFCDRLREALQAQGVTGADGACVDHVQLTGLAVDRAHSARNFVLNPGLAWDRSPCGTGTSARLACLAADNQLLSGAVWRQESITGSVLEASWQPAETAGQVVVTLVGRAYVTLEGKVVIQQDDPLGWGRSDLRD